MQYKPTECARFIEGFIHVLSIIHRVNYLVEQYLNFSL